MRTVEDTGDGGDGGGIPIRRNLAWERTARRLQIDYDEALGKFQESQRKVDELVNKRDQFRTALNNILAQMPGAQAAIDSAKQQAADLSLQVAEFTDARNAATARLLGTDSLRGTVSTKHPLLLLPVRLETRFVSAQSGSGTELLLRVYPDDVHIDTHEPELTDEEVRWGNHFREQIRNAESSGDPAPRKQQAWQQLGERFGAQRAAWIARTLDLATGAAVARKDGAWTRAPHTQVLPDRWVAVGYREQQAVVTAWGKRIPDQLPTGPSPQAAPIPDGDGLPRIDEGMRWMLDFAAAEVLGMALRIPLTAEQAALGFERLVVVGVKASLDDTASAERLTQLFDAHHYTGGLAFVGQNVPTNNTEALSSGYRSGSRDAALTFPVERGDPLAQPGSDGELTAKALGISPAVFAHVLGADGAEQRHAQLVNTAFLTVSDSALLRQLSGVADVEFLKEHFTNFVRARGPLPALRVDTQPYGLLPVAALDRWRTLEGSVQETALADWWRTHRQAWRQAVARAIDMEREANPFSLLAQDANACHYVMREFPEAVTIPLEPRLLDTPSTRDRLLNRVLELLHDPAADVLKTLPDSVRQALTAEAVDLLTFRFDAWATAFATRRLAQLRRDTPKGIRLGAYGWVEHLKRGPPLQPVQALPAGTTGPLFLSEANKGYVHAPSLAHAATAAVLRSGYLAHLHEADGSDGPFAVDLSSDRVHRAKWMLDGVRQGQSLAALLGYRFERGLHERGLDHYIHRFRALASLKEVDELAQAQAAVAKAQEHAREVAALYEQSRQAHERAVEARAVMAEQKKRLDLYQQEVNSIKLLEQRAHDADASLALAMQTFRAHQGERPKSRAEWLGKYQVQIAEVEDFREWANSSDALEQQLSDAQDAATAAHQTVSALAVNRDNAQAALEKLRDVTIPGVQEVISLEEDMAKKLNRQGLDMEGEPRGTAEKQLADARIALAALLNQQWDKALESLAANNVVDGLELHRRWKEGQRRKPPQAQWDATTIPFGDATLGFPKPDSEDFKALDAQLRALDEMADAVGDTVVAESVYQMVQGNPLRSGATLDAIASGELPPPEMEVVRTPRTGIGLTHRLCALFPVTDTVAPPTWPINPGQVRAQAEPVLNAWVATLLPQPSQVRCKVDYVNAKDGSVYRTTEVPLATLELSPLDAVFMAEGGNDAQRSELEQRLLYQLSRSRPSSLPPDAELRLSFARDEAWPLDVVSVGEFSEMTQTIRKLLSTARALDGRDLSLPESPAAVVINVEELTQRTTRVVQALTQARQALQSLLPPEPAERDGTAVDLEALRASLLQMASFGIQGAVPLSAEGESLDARSTLLLQARSVVLEVKRRLGRISDLERDFDATQAVPEARRDHDLARMKEIFGSDFRVLPQITAANGAILADSFGASASLQANDTLAATTWLQRASRVRDGVMRFDAVMAYAEALGDGGHLDLQVGQLPYKAGDRWVALPCEPGQTIPGGRLSIVAQMGLPAPLRFDRPIAGLLIDEWVETVPSKQETTGLTFHYDQPNTAAPQAILLGVPSDGRPSWDLDSLEAILRETMELARMRAVAPTSEHETVWVDDGIPDGATAFEDGESWTWVRLHPAPLSGKVAHQSGLVAGSHQHYFQGAKNTLPVSVGDRLFAHVYLDAAHPPREVMLKWHDGQSWEHRAYWGENLLNLGTDGSFGRQHVGPLPVAGQWVRLEIPAAIVGLEGQTISGMAFALWDGRATWDRAGKVSAQPAAIGTEDITRPALFFDDSAIDWSSIVETQTGV